LPSACARHGPCQAYGLCVRVTGQEGCFGLPAADRARARSAAGIAGFHIRLSLRMFECLCACALVCLFRLTHAIIFSCNAHAERPHEGGGSCYPGALLFCGVPKQVYVLPVEGDCVFAASHASGVHGLRRFMNQKRGGSDPNRVEVCPHDCRIVICPRVPPCVRGTHLVRLL